MKIYLICPVRGSSYDPRPLVESLKAQGHEVHSPLDANQDDPTGIEICRAHLKGMHWCDNVYIVWDVNSKGSHFDLGMAFALGRPMTLVEPLHPDTEGKSYQKVIMHVQAHGRRGHWYDTPMGRCWQDDGL